jgi:hypothetical protein
LTGNPPASVSIPRLLCQDILKKGTICCLCSLSFLFYIKELTAISEHGCAYMTVEGRKLILVNTVYRSIPLGRHSTSNWYKAQ